MTFEDYLKIAKMQAAADLGIDAAAFESGAHVFAAKDYGSRARKTLTGRPILDMVYFGRGLVAVADEKIVPFVEEYLGRCGQNLFRAFDAPNIFTLNRYIEKYGNTVGEIAQGFLPVAIADNEVETGGDIAVLYGEEISRLYGYKDFGEALCYTAIAERRDVIAVAYYDKDRPVAVAACSNDGEDMYQIGVDVLPEYRRRGMAKRLVQKLTELIAKSGKCPYYRCAWSNIASRRTAAACGYTDAWVELSARPIGG